MMPSFAELAIVLFIVLILFGAGKLPQVFEALGQGMKKFREAQNEVDDDDPPKDVTRPTPQITRASAEEVEVEEVAKDRVSSGN